MSSRYNSRKDKNIKPRSKSRSSSSNPSYRNNKYKDYRPRRHDYYSKYNNYRQERDTSYKYNREFRVNEKDNIKDVEDPMQQPLANSYALIASNISRNVQKRHLIEIFGAYGNVNVYIPRDPESRLAKGYIFLEYTSKEEADKAFWYMNGGQLDGNIIKVEYLEGKKNVQQDKKRRRSRSRRRSGSRNKFKYDKPKYDRKKKESSSSGSSESSSESSSSRSSS
jgi:RNA recognition motif-containing protein